MDVNTNLYHLIPFHVVFLTPHHRRNLKLVPSHPYRRLLETNASSHWGVSSTVVSGTYEGMAGFRNVSILTPNIFRGLSCSCSHIGSCSFLVIMQREDKLLHHVSKYSLSFGPKIRLIGSRWAIKCRKSPWTKTDRYSLIESAVFNF